MISIRHSMTELEQCQKLRDVALESYLAAVRNVAHYTIDLDPEITAPQQKYLSALAQEVASGKVEALVESRATLRGLLRDYRDKAAEYLAKLRDELAGTAHALQEMMDSLVQSDGNHEGHLRTALRSLRGIPPADPQREVVLAAADVIESSLAEIRKQHQVTVSQFVAEIRVLHKRIDALETAATIDDLTKLFNRPEMEERIRSQSSGCYCLLLVKVNGLRSAAVDFNDSVAAELTGAFTKRLRNSVPAGTVIGRWGEEEFIAILQATKAESMNSAKFVAEHIGGAYACLKDGKTVRPVVQLRVGMIDSGGDRSDKILERVTEFLTGK